MCINGTHLWLYSDGYDESYDGSDDSREKIIAAEKRERKELIMEQFALRRGGSKEDEVSKRCE